jgi:hypothetical protein
LVTELPARKAVVTANQLLVRRTKRSSAIWHKKLDASAMKATTNHQGLSVRRRGHESAT